MFILLTFSNSIKNHANSNGNIMQIPGCVLGYFVCKSQKNNWREKFSELKL